MHRRKFIQHLGLIPALSFSTKMSLASSNRLHDNDFQYLNINEQKDLHIIHRKLCFTYDRKIVFWFINAKRYALVDKKFLPLWNMPVGFLSQVKTLDEYRYMVRTLSIIFYTDIKDNQILSILRNPVTGQIINVKQPSIRISDRFYNIMGLEDSKNQTLGSVTTEYGDIGPAWNLGDDLWLNADNGFRIEPINNKVKLRQVNDWFTYHGSLKEVSRSDVMSAQSTQSFHDFNTFPKWLGMDSIQGSYVARGFGKKVFAIEDMPQLWKKLTKNKYPDYYNNPEQKIDLF